MLTSASTLVRTDLTLLQSPLVIGLAGIAILLVFGLVRDRFDRRWMRRGDPSRNRLTYYTRTIVIQLTLAIVCVVSWRVAGRDFGDLGLRAPNGFWSWAMVGVTLVALASLFASWWRTTTSSETRERVRKRIEASGKLDLIRPTNPVEFRRFRWVALNAGIMEEIAFRGFLIGSLALVMPIWVASIVAILVFGLAHAYQGATGIFRVLPFTALLTIIFVVSGSLWPVMALHVAADVIGGEVARLADQSKDCESS